jgi:hypothetical protein
MSNYCTIRGWVTYPNRAALDKAVKFLVRHKWLAEDHSAFLDEIGRKRCHDKLQVVCTSALTINIPQDSYRNLGGYMDELIEGDGVKYRLLWGYEGSTVGILNDGIPPCAMTLQEYAKKNNLEVKERSDDLDNDQMIDLLEWQNEVEDHFFCSSWEKAC